MFELSKRCQAAWGRIGAAMAVLCALSAPASAHYRLDVRLDIAATPASVTRSTATLGTFASYRFTLTSLERSRFDHCTFKGTVVTSGLPAGSTAAATLFDVSGASCTLSNGVLECAIPGALNECDQSLSFTVTLKTPTAGTGISVSGTSAFVEHYYVRESTNTASAATTLTEPSPDSLSTYVPASATQATTLFSGTNTVSGVVGAIPIVDPKAVPPINDPFTTTVIVPAGSAATTATVAESEVLASCSANPRCFQSKLTIPGTFDFLKIILRRDKTTLMTSRPKGNGHDDDDCDDDDRYGGQSAIDNAIVKYFPDDDPSNPDKFIIVPNCSIVPGGLPMSKHPCIESRKAYPKKSSHKSPVPAGLEGDWEFVIRALDNGRYTN